MGLDPKKQKKIEKVIVVCKGCKYAKPVAPEKVPTNCPVCRTPMYPRSNW